MAGFIKAIVTGYGIAFDPLGTECPDELFPSQGA